MPANWKRSRPASGSSRSTTCCSTVVRRASVGCFASSASTPRRTASSCRSPRTRPTSTPSTPPRKCRIPAAARSNAASRASCAGTRWRWSCAPTASRTASAGTSRRMPRPRRCTRSASTTSSAAARTAAKATSIYFQGHASPGIYARAFLEGRITRAAARKLPPRAAGPSGGLSSYPHPWLMPDFWEFPTVSMGLGPIMAIYQARFNRYLEDRGLKPRHRCQGLGVSRRRRDRRARSARRHHARVARAARQPDLRRQLQPAAARRSGARQRPDHHRARSDLPRRRLERHQSAVGHRVGRPPRKGHRRPARPPDGRDRRRRVPEVRRRDRAPTSASTSGAPTRDCSRWSSTSRTSS